MRQNIKGRDPIQRVVIPRLPRPTSAAAKTAQEPFWNEVVKRLNVVNEVSDGCIQEPLTFDCIENSDADPTFRLNDYLYNQSNLARLRTQSRDPMTRARVPATAWDVAFPPAPAAAAAAVAAVPPPPAPGVGGQIVTAANAQVGLRVVRGPNWAWGNQDGGAGGQGTIINMQFINRMPLGGATVVWDHAPNNERIYRLGGLNDQQYDLRIAPGHQLVDFVD
jgi:hypothetical protein